MKKQNEKKVSFETGFVLDMRRMAFLMGMPITIFGIIFNEVITHRSYLYPNETIPNIPLITGILFLAYAFFQPILNRFLIKISELIGRFTNKIIK